MAKPRTTIPPDLAAQVLFDADLSCCVCHQRGNHIHHIDGDPSNNGISNLVLLCFTHHDEVTAKGGLSRRLTSNVLTKYREDWHQRVRSHRKVGTEIDLDWPMIFFNAALDAHSCLEVWKLKPRIISAEWVDVGGLLSDLGAILSPLTINAKYEAIQCLDLLATSTRHGMPSIIATTIRNLAEECLSLRRFPSQDIPATVNERDSEAFAYGLEIAGSLIHDGDKYLENLQVVVEGCNLYWKILLHARCIKSKSLEDAADKCFEWYLPHRSGNARFLMELYRKNGIDGSPREPMLPPHIDEILAAATDREMKLDESGES